jgi:uncharacterized membrane protein
MKWLLGGIGFLLGYAGSRFDGAMAGLVLGFLAGGFIDYLRRPRSSPNGDPAAAAKDADIARIDAALADIHWRLKRIEEAAALGPSPLQQAVAARAAPPIQAQAVDETAVQPLAADAWGVERPLAAGVASAVAEPVAARVEAAADVAPAPAFAPAPEVPRKPGALDLAWAWFTGGNTVVKVGIFVLFFGVAFLIKYAAEHAVVPIEWRLAGVMLSAFGLLGFGWRLARRHATLQREEGDDEAVALARIRAGYGLLLQGAAVGLLYLTVFGAFRLYALLPATAALTLMCAIVLLSVLLAVKQDAISLAIFGTAGGFLAPILASSGGGSHVGLFSFYALLNAGIFTIAWFKAWRVLNLLGFVFTFGLAGVWGFHAYRPEHLASTEPFLVLFFLMYLAVAVLFATREAPRLRSYVDGTIVFGTPIVAFGLQAALMRETPHGAALSALALALVYLLAGLGVRSRAPVNLRLLVECFFALALVFATLSVPLALDGRWTSAVWALEGAAVVWAGTRQSRRLARAFGYLVMLAGAFAFLGAREHWQGAGDVPVANAAMVGQLLIALSALFVARLIDLAPRGDGGIGDGERRLGSAFTLWGGLWWLCGGWAELDRWLTDGQTLNAGAVFVAASAALAWVGSRWWPRARFAVVAVLPLLALIVVAMLVQGRHPFADGGWLAWPLALTLHYGVLRALELASQDDADAVPGLVHALGVWLVTVLAGAELRHQALAWGGAHGEAAAVALALPPALVTWWVSSRRLGALWPVSHHLRAYLLPGLVPLVLAGWAWMFAADIRHDGHGTVRPYLPFANPLDLTHGLVIFALVAWWRALDREEFEPPLPQPWLAAALAGAVFFWLNAVLLRTLHHWGGVPYRFDDMMRSMLVQAALSIFWTVLALMLMWHATRRLSRGLWTGGAVLIGVVVAKLFLVDLSNIGGIERIVSFIAVGVLMLGIGYFSPLPPRRAESP